MRSFTPIALACIVSMSLSACMTAPRRPVMQTTDVRLDMVARSLARAEEAYADRWHKDPAPNRTEMDDLERSLAQAQDSLQDAERAADAWRDGDHRPWMRVRSCLAEDLAKVDAALQRVGLLPQPGLVEAIPPSEPCRR